MSSTEYMKRFVMNTANGFMGTYVLYAACELKIFDKLADGGKDINALAEATGTSAELLIRIVRPLVVYQLISRSSSGVYELEEGGRLLVSTDSSKMWGYVMFCGREGTEIWSRVSEGIHKNCSPYQLCSKEGLFDAQSKNSEQFDIFDSMMKNVSAKIELSGFFDEFADDNAEIKILDIGGGTGTIISRFLERYRKSTGVIADLEQAEEEAKKNIRRLGLDDRCRFLRGSFFEDIPEKADCIILSRVLHDWNDEDALKILETSVNCMNSGAKLLIIENIMLESDDRSALEAYMNDIQMWGFCGGKERTAEEFAELLSKVGLTIKAVHQTASDSNVKAIEAFIDNSEEGEI